MQEYSPQSQQPASQFHPREMHDELTEQIKRTGYLRHPTFHANNEVWGNKKEKKNK